MKKLPVPAKVTEAVIFIVLSTSIMSPIEIVLMGMHPRDVLINRATHAMLNAASLLGAGEVRRAAVATVERLRSFGLHIGLSRLRGDPGPVGTVWRTITAISELTIIQLCLYLPIASLLGADEVVLLVGCLELGIGCSVLWSYHNGYEWFYETYVRPGIIGGKRVLRRARAIGHIARTKGDE